MITSTQLYWLVMLDNINLFFGVLFTIFVLFLAICGFGMISCYQEGEDTIAKIFRSFLICFAILSVLSGLAATFIPNTKQMAAIIVIPAIANAVAENEDAKEIPGELVKLANDWIQQFKPNEKTAE